MRICDKCQLEYDDKFTYCQKCGNKLNVKEEKKICSNCGKEIETDGEFCPFCGEIIKGDLSDSVIAPSHETTVKSHEKKEIKINEIKVSSTQEKLVQTPNNTNKKKSDKKLSMLITIIVIFLVLATSLGFDNIGYFISANQADFYEVTDIIKMGELRRDLFNPPESMTEEEYYKKKDEYRNTRNDRILRESDYKHAHQELVNNKSSLQKFDNLTSYMFNTRKAALKMEESVLNRGGTWIEAQEAYDTVMNGK